ncbi:MAG: monovalent cation/H(+) antiporter subunit G [Planctomycetota bacterium]|nr:monovalent cation/H(+) antiporter subunit G [Planctomycetota bacterium]
MIDVLASVVLLLGAAFMLVAALGALRLPDILMRMHAVTKAGALGVGLIAISAALLFDDVSAVTRALLMVLFVFITLPVAAHVIGRAAYFSGVPLWAGTVADELRPAIERRRGRGGQGDG